ncbi:MAG: hypothetical protein CVV53_07530 [Spirochaetae bacterium HGW-Spirochaetae-9]|nr:MAG: hypothetical protein CVV53_07530 [Spirochaetae bacterium HGW-Spirochaetae-9]
MAESSSRPNHSSGWLFVFPAIIVVALVINGFNPSSRQVSLYFLDADRSRLVAEKRSFSLAGTIEERASLVIEELLLRPFSPELQPLFKQEVNRGSVMHRNNKLHVEIELPDLASLDIPFGLISDAFEKTLSSVVPGAGNLELYVNGNLVVD